MNTTFSYLVTRFFTSYLATEQGLSHNTIAAYSDSMRLLINYVCSHLCIEPEKISTETLSRELILDFLNHLETNRGNTEATRNQRLAAIKSFFHFLARTVPELMQLNESIQAIRPKKTDHVPPSSLTIAEVNALISAPDPSRLLGSRDKALLQILYNTGARVQEIADLTISNLRTEEPATVTLTGKGRKQRIVPLWPGTIQLIQNYLRFREQAGITSDHLFLNNKGCPITRFGIGRRVEHHAQIAALSCPSLQNRRVTPHLLRHTTALHLIESGSDITIVKEWLGHADLKTTSHYIEVSIERKRAALEKVLPPKQSPESEPPKWQKPTILDFLTSLARKASYVAKPPPATPPPSLIDC